MRALVSPISDTEGTSVLFKNLQFIHLSLMVYYDSPSSQNLTLRRPLRRKVRMRWFFDISKVKESSFFLNRTSMTPHQIFNAHLLDNTDLSPSRFIFQ